MIKVLSFGAGVQSVTLLQLAIDGRMERPDYVIFADTQCEPQSVYDAVARSADACAKVGLPFFTVTRGDLGAWRANGAIHVPLFTRSLTDGSLGRLFRTCTDRFKIQAIKEKCRDLGAGHRRGGAEMWIGFSVDEIHRVGGGDGLPKWVTRRFPLLELGMRRSDCDAYLRERGIEAAKSACTFCPYRSAEGWTLFRGRDPVGFAHAVAYDETIRHARPGYLCYVNRDCQPLADILVPPPGLFDEPVDDGCETGFCFA